MEHKPAVSISVVVPVYRSDKILLSFYDRCSRQLDLMTNDWELILVDDASPDGSWDIATSLHDKNPKVKAIRFSRNQGQQHATLCGLGYASKEYVVTMDDDLQCFPEDLPLFINMLRSDKQVVIGRIPPTEKHHSKWRNFGSRINQRLAGKIIGKPKEIGLSSFRAMTKRVAKQLVEYKGAHPHISALLFKSVPAVYIANVDIRHASRADDTKTTYSLSKMIKTLSYLVINHSYLPLRFVIGWGITISFLSLAFALWVFARSIYFQYTLPGWASLAVLVSFLCGNILFALGVLGEYLGRLVEESSNIGQFSIYEEKL